MSKKNKVILIILAIVAVLSVVAVTVVLSYNHVDHGAVLSKQEIAQYSNAITIAARSYTSINADEFVILDTVNKEMGGNTDITFRVYKLPEGAQVSDYASLRVSDLPADFAPEYMGTGNARLIKDSLTQIIVTVTYYK